MTTETQLELTKEFEGLNLSTPILNAISEMGFTKASSIQAEAILS